MTIFEKNPEQSYGEYKLRLFNNRINYGMTWKQIADCLNAFDFQNKSSDAYRKESKHFCNKQLRQNISNNYMQDLSAQTKQLVQKYKLFQQLNQNRAYVRRISREQTIKQIAADYADKMAKSGKVFLNTDCFSCDTNSTKQGILCLSDWHYGIQCKNAWNVYNTNIARERISELKTKVLQYIQKNDINKLYVLNLGDLICGRIHLTLRLESRIDVITQVMQVSEILAEFLFNLSHFVEIEYYSCSDNHSRIEPDKTNSLDLESLTRIIDWYLPERLKQTTNIHFMTKTNYDDDIIQFNIGDTLIGAVHGHKDSFTNVANNLRAMSGDDFNMIFTAHQHHPQMSQENCTLVIGNGSLMGVDTYAKNLRKTSRPSQTLVVLDNGKCESIHIITFD